MIILFQQILITFILVMGLKIALSEDMLLEKLGAWLDKKSDEYKVFNLFICPWCMSTLQSITAYFFAFGLGWLPFQWDWKYLIMWPLIVMGGSFLSGNTWNIYEMINRIKERNEAEARYYQSFFEETSDN